MLEQWFPALVLKCPSTEHLRWLPNKTHQCSKQHILGPCFNDRAPSLTGTVEKDFDWIIQHHQIRI